MLFPECHLYLDTVSGLFLALLCVPMDGIPKRQFVYSITKITDVFSSIIDYLFVVVLIYLKDEHSVAGL